MTNLFIRWFVKDYKNVTNPGVRQRYGKFAGLMGIISNLVLFLIKIVVGSLSGSVSIMADAVNNLSDSGSSIVTMLGFKLSGRPADAKHPYGHGRMEYISGLIVSFIILLLGVQLVQVSVDKILHPQVPQFSLAVVAVLAISMLIKLWQSLFYRKISRTIDSLMLLTTSADSRNDIIATAAVLAGAVMTRLTGFNLDGWLGIAVALFIIVSGIKLVAETISPLLGSAPNRELVHSIQNKVLSFDGIIGVHDLTVHNYGPSQCFASLHCEVPADQDIMVSHDIIDNIENEFLKEQGIHMIIHLDPVVTGDERTDALKAQVALLINDISPDISMHDFRVVWGLSHTNLIFDVAIPFDFELSDERLKQRISEQIATLSSTYHTKIIVDHTSA